MYTLLKTRVLDFRNYPTLMDRPASRMYGARNKFALLGVCRQIYHETAPWAYGENFYQIDRGHHREFRIPKYPGMPYQMVQYISLQYPYQIGPCCWELNHMWEHWLNDARLITKIFPRVKMLLLKLFYNAYSARNTKYYDSWKPLFSRNPGETEVEMRTRIVKTLRALATIHGAKMPKCVRFQWVRFVVPAPQHHGPQLRTPPDHDTEVINDAIPLAWNSKINLEEFDDNRWPVAWPKRQEDIRDSDSEISDLDHTDSDPAVSNGPGSNGLTESSGSGDDWTTVDGVSNPDSDSAASFPTLSGIIEQLNHIDEDGDTTMSN